MYFTAIETDTPEPEIVQDPGPAVPEAQLARSRPIINGFLDNHERLLAEVEIQRQIGRLERVFMATGDYHKFLGILRDDFETRGADSHVADRYAWTLIRLGQRQQARETLDVLLADRADDADVHFLDGAYWLQEQPQETDDLKKVVTAWEKTLALDPAYQNYDVNAQMLQGQLTALREQLGTAAVEPAAAAGQGDMKAMAEALVQKAVADEAAEEEPVQPDAEQAEGREEDQAEEQAADDQPVEEPTEEIAEASRNAPRSMNKEYRILVAKGQIALGQSNYREAEQSFVQARAIKPNAFEAEFGQLQAQWGKNEGRNDVANRLRRLAEKSSLTARQRIDLGTFLWTKMARKDLARKLFDAAKAADPAVAAEVDSLVDQMKP